MRKTEDIFLIILIHVLVPLFRDYGFGNFVRSCRLVASFMMIKVTVTCLWLVLGYFSVILSESRIQKANCVTLIKSLVLFFVVVSL